MLPTSSVRKPRADPGLWAGAYAARSDPFEVEPLWRVVMKQRDLSGIFTDPGVIFFSKHDRVKCKIFPNHMFYDADQKTGVLVVMQSRSGADYALAKQGLSYLKTAQDKGGKVIQGYVVLADGDLDNPTFVRQNTLDNVIKGLNGEPPREGRMGPYWWLTATMEVIKQERATAPVEASRTPF
jgi:hypothetical protein